jgi:hypothetical protein
LQDAPSIHSGALSGRVSTLAEGSSSSAVASIRLDAHLDLKSKGKMRFAGKPTAKDIFDLIKNAVHEDRELDYKETLPDKSAESHRDFLYDVSSFANAAGGLLVFGVRERRESSGKSTGEPDEAVGLLGFNQDEDIRRLESMLRDGVEPRIPGIRLHIVPGLKNGPALALSVPKSWVGPHMVKYGGMARFYTRNNRGNEPMNYHQIRDAFAESSTAIDRARQFRDERIQKIATGTGLPTELHGRARSVLHLIPLSVAVLDTVNILRPRQEADLLPVPGWRSVSDTSHKLNFDGFARTASQISYVQLFRSGSVEAVDAHLLNFASSIPWPTLEAELIEQTIRYLTCLQMLGCDPPIGVALTLVNVSGLGIAADGTPSFPRSQGLDRGILKLPEVVAENFDDDVPSLMRPIFDTLWQSCGRERSRSYDADGKCTLNLRT